MRAEAAFALFFALAAPAAEAYTIKGPDNPKPWEATAVQELTDYLSKRVVGRAKVTVGGRSAVTFHVGDTAFAARKGLSSKTMEEECWTIRSFGGDVVLNGGGYRGCLYAVYHFLEDYCGVRWWSEKEEDILGSGDLILPKLNVKDRPAFFYRDICRDKDPAKATSRHAVRRRLNCNWTVPIPLSLGGAVTIGPPSNCHSMEFLMPFDKYGKDHPEYFCLRNGKRPTNGNRIQPCITNPDMRRIMLESVLENIEKGKAEAKAGGFAAPTFYDVSMNDNSNFCECPECTAAVERAGHAGLNLELINYIAAEVAKRHPEVVLTTFAYRFMEDPPKTGIKAAPNVAIRFCPLGANFAKSITDPDDKDNSEIRARLEAWRKHVDTLLIWDYAVTFGWDTWGYPFPNEWYFGEKYRYYVSRGVRGIMWEQEGTRNADLFDLKYYFLSKLAEKPDLDYPALMKRTFTEFFGPKAGPLMYAVRKRLRDAAEKSREKLDWMGKFPMFRFISDADAEFMTDAYNRAEKAVAGDARYIRRIKRARLRHDHLVWRRNNLLVRDTFDGKPCWMANPAVYAYVLRTEGRHKNDPLSPTGTVLEIGKLPGHVSPLRFLYRDLTTKQDPRSRSIVIPENEKEYVWLDAGRATLVENGAFYMTSSSLIQIYTPKELAGKTFDVKLLARTTKEGHIRLGRLALVDVDDSGETKTK